MSKTNYQQFSSYHVAVDCVIFGYEGEQLKLLVHPRRLVPASGEWSLMGGFVTDQEDMDGAARRVLKECVGLDNIYLEQVKAYSNPDRDPGGRVISMAYFALIRIQEQDKTLVEKHGAQWFNVNDLPLMVFDHRKMADECLKRLQYRASLELIGSELLPEQFTLTQLNNLYNVIFQKQFDPGNFRKKIKNIDVLERLNIKEKESSKRGAYYYRFKETNDNDSRGYIVRG